MRRLELIIDAGMAGKNLDKIIREAFGLTKKQISQAKFRKNGITVNGAQARISHVGQLGERLEICLEQTREDAGRVLPVPGNLEILYEDEDLIALCKPGGIPCHPGRGHYEDSLGNRLAAYLLKKGEQTPVRAIGRLDKDTSGIMVYAKNQIAAARLWEQKEQGILQKEYLALVQGVPRKNRGQIQAPIGPMPGEKLKMCVDRAGKQADTEYELLQSFILDSKSYALVRCRIATGRTHQIRVHMSYLGHPVVGDVLYGDGENPFFPGLALHAGSMVLLQPYTGEKTFLECSPRHWSLWET